jgi:autotransporter-associated beta strand protein
VLGPTGALVVVRENAKFEAVGGARLLANDFDSYGFTVTGAHDLEISGSLTNLGSAAAIKKGAGTLVLSGDNSGWGNAVEIHEGVLFVGHTNALGTTGINFWGGVLELGVGDLNRTLAYDAAGNSGTIAWRDQAPGPCDGGFSAYGGDRSVTLDSGATLGWGSPLTKGSTPGFVSTGRSLVFGSHQSNAKLIFQNPIDLNGETGTIRVNDNTNSTADRAVMAGVLSGTGDSALMKSGDGTLFFNAMNTYSGITSVIAGAVGGNGQLASSLAFNPGSGFVADWSALSAPLTVLGSVNLSYADTLTVLGEAPAEVRTVILTSSIGITGTFDTVKGLSGQWRVDYSVPGEVALKPVVLTGAVMIVR